MTPPLLRFNNLAAVSGIVHAISTRDGGVSEGSCATLNTSFSVGDDVARVDENLARLAQAVGSRRQDLFSAYQVHGNSVFRVGLDHSPEARPRCDVLVTDDPSAALMLRFADCTPVLLADPRKKVVAVVHAGWRGSAERAAGAAVNALVETYGSNPRDLLAGIGPAIGPCCYAVGNDVVNAFSDRPWALSSDGDQHPRLDLWAANREALVEAGVPSEQIELARICTHCQPERFFSHRAHGGQPAGRFAAVIRLAA